jgi:hypothetical protein
MLNLAVECLPEYQCQLIHLTTEHCQVPIPGIHRKRKRQTDPRTLVLNLPVAIKRGACFKPLNDLTWLLGIWDCAGGWSWSQGNKQTTHPPPALE